MVSRWEYNMIRTVPLTGECQLALPSLPTLGSEEAAEGDVKTSNFAL